MNQHSTSLHCVFYQSASAEARPCKVTVSGQELLIYFQDATGGFQSWNISSLGFSGGGPDRVRITRGGMTIEAHGPSAAVLLSELSNPAVIKESPRFFRPSHLAIIALGGLVITAILVFTAYLLLPLAAGKIANMVPMEYEVQLGESLVSAYVDESGQAPDSVDFYADRFVKQLRLDTDYPIKVRVIISDEINAFALPGGNIFIYSGLLEKMNSHEELAALLGHEISHVTRRHSLKSMFSSAAAGVLIGSVFGDMGGVSSWVLSQADRFKQLDYSRELEMEADNYGLEIMKNNKIDPKGVVRLLQLLEEEGAETPVLMKYLSTHPEIKARIDNIRQSPSFASAYEDKPSLTAIFESLKAALKNPEKQKY